MTLLLLATSLHADLVSTRCAVADVPISRDITSWRLIGCGDGFPDNLAWHVDRSDGVMDARALRVTTGRGVIVYVLDSGVMRDHDELAHAVIDGFDAATPHGYDPVCATPDASTQPCWFSTEIDLMQNSHGTGVASVIAGRNVGIAPDAKIVSIRTQTSSGTSPAVYVDALNWIDAHAPQGRTSIVNLSGGMPPSAEVEAKIRAMTADRFFFAVAPGNVAAGQCTLFPATRALSIDGLVAVGGITRENQWWTGSCGGPIIELAAPAHDLLVATITARDHYRGNRPAGARDGTSYATAYVSGIAARILEREPALTPAQLEARLKGSASRVDGIAVPVLVETLQPRRRSVR